MTLTKRLIFLFLTLCLVVSIGTAVYSALEVRKEVYALLVEDYGEHFRIVSDNLSAFFGGIRSDVLTLADNALVRGADDAGFTSFLNADERSFEYHYSDQELAIIKLFNDYRLNHPHVNSVYMGRANGTFVRSHPRSQPTRYDPRDRSWYQLALENPGAVVLTSAYPSVTNKDINFGTVIALLSPKNEVLGVLGMDVTIERLSQNMSQMRFSLDGTMELWDETGTVLITTQQDHLYAPADQATDYEVVHSAGGVDLERGGDYFRIVHTVDVPKGQLVALIPAKAVTSRILKTIRGRVTFVLTVLILLAIWNYIMIEWLILKPMRGMSAVLKASQISGEALVMDIKASGELLDFQKEYNQLVNAIEQEENELKRVKLLTITSLSSLAELRDYETGLHIIRTQKYVEILAITYNHLFSNQAIPENKVTVMVQCAPLHDIGKVAIPDDILLKPGPLTVEEFEVMKKHTLYGKQTIEKGNMDIGDHLFIKTAVNLVYHHHERWDGNGYPEALQGETIPIEARIMSVADVYDALTTKRVYKEAIPHDEATEIIKSGRGTQFDPDIVDVFLSVEDTFRAVSELYREV